MEIGIVLVMLFLYILNFIIQNCTSGIPNKDSFQMVACLWLLTWKILIWYPHLELVLEYKRVNLLEGRSFATVSVFHAALKNYVLI